MRPSNDTDKKLINAAKELIHLHGNMDFSMRDVASHANVNLGMFYYHFKNREDFFSKVIQETYEDFFINFKLDATKYESPVKNLEHALKFISIYIASNFEIVKPIAKAVIRDEDFAKKVIVKNFPRHIFVLLNIIKQAQKQGELIKLPPAEILTSLMGAVNIPSLIANILESNNSLIAGIVKYRFNGRELISKNAINKRVELILNAYKR